VAGFKMIKLTSWTSYCQEDASIFYIYFFYKIFCAIQLKILNSIKSFVIFILEFKRAIESGASN